VIPAFRPLENEQARYLGAYGGRGGAKSHYFAEKLVRITNARAGTRFVCIREIQNSLEQSVKRLIEDKIAAFGLSDRYRIMTTHIETPGDGIIIFKGMRDQTAESIKSLEGYDYAWVEEAQSLSQTSLDLLRPTIRKEGSQLWFSWNPTDVQDPVDVLFRSGDPPPGAVAVQVSYLDNPYFPEVLRRDLEWDKARSPDKFEHVWGGGYRKISEATVFRNWQINDALGEPPEGTTFYLGGDWGFSTDPTAGLRLYVPQPRKLVIDREVYQVGCEIEDTPSLFDSLLCDGLCPLERDKCERPTHRWARQWPLIADSARPETISYLKRHGYPKIEASHKGPNSVEEGIVFMQGYDIEVHPRCVNVINELTYYRYKVDKHTGKVLPVLVDEGNHTIDASRYALEPLRAEVAPAGGLLW
jgi:phage terminase large subunit